MGRLIWTVFGGRGLYSFPMVRRGMARSETVDADEDDFALTIGRYALGEISRSARSRRSARTSTGPVAKVGSQSIQ